MEFRWSDLANRARASEIRELLKYTEKPGMISFAGGLPGPEVFPVEDIAEITKDILAREGTKALQYSKTEGVTYLRKKIVEYMSKDGINLTEQNILITTGAQQAIDLLLKTLLNPNERIIVEAPTYLAFIQAAELYNIQMPLGITLNSDGMNVDALEKELLKTRSRQFLYTIPTFHNPATVVMSEKKRQRLLEIANAYDLIVIEDDPYSKLRYDGKPIKSLKARDDSGRVVYVGTFSKLLSPGFRIGWVAADANLIKKLTIVKQPADLCSGSFGQYIIAEFLARGLLEKQIKRITEDYRHKRDIMWDAIKKYFPPGTDCAKPEGGLFLWATIPRIDTKLLLEKALKQHVAFVPGATFYADGRRSSSMRLNFSYSSDEQIKMGIETIGNIAKGMM